MFLIGGPKYLGNFIVREQVVRTLEITALVAYDGKPVRLKVQTVCVNPGDYMKAVSLSARPLEAAAALPDGSAIAFKGMLHYCRLAETIANQNLIDAASPPVLRGEMAVPSPYAVWFSDPRHPEVVEAYLAPDPIAQRYRPISFSMREIPNTSASGPATASQKVLPAWTNYKNESLGLCSAMIARLPPDALSEDARRELVAGHFQPQEFRHALTKTGGSPFFRGEVNILEQADAATNPDLRRMLDEDAAARSRILVPILENGTWVAHPLQATRYYAHPSGLPETVRIGGATVKFRNHWISPLPGTPDVVAMQGNCLPRH